ncbi:hypothetical protein GQ43DRAFT_443126 [Delitschia confertaspora ATCC 74209]|uniref:Nudix hydrolase domain-containing protein n=1 Tax=Delitschia confertaspora ATCC 74209 TaxID=1513339 RepID=A0A9P4MMU7_9PLEO|nr:hypothetical protein GQ43DRAFT_443126 [Delitschia confertaspora ATCC 74209]
MSTSDLTFEVPASLAAYCVSEREYIQQHPDYHILVVGAVVFHEERLLLVQRAASDTFPNLQEFPGGKMDDIDETILHAVARELKEETGLEATKFVRKVGEMDWQRKDRRTGENLKWLKLIFEVKVKEINVVLDPAEHQQYLFATEEEILNDKAKGVELSFISPLNKAIKLEAFKLRRGLAAT